MMHIKCTEQLFTLQWYTELSVRDKACVIPSKHDYNLHIIMLSVATVATHMQDISQYIASSFSMNTCSVTFSICTHQM